MKILVVGSLRAKNLKSELEAAIKDGTSSLREEEKNDLDAYVNNKLNEFRESCKAIGKHLASKNVELIIGSTRDSTADRWVIEGIKQAPKTTKVRVTLIRPQNSRADETSTDTVLDPNTFDIRFKPMKASWTGGRIAQVQACDCVLMLGGSEGTAQVGFSAMSLGIPVVAVASFFGAAKKMWVDFDEYYKKVEGTVPEYSHLGQPTWRTHYPIVIYSLASALIKSKVAKRTDWFRELSPLLASLVFFSSWVGVFVSGLNEQYLTAFFLITALSAFLGTSLRRSLSAVLSPTSPITGAQFLSEVNAGLLLAFILSLIYLSGSLTVAGDLDVFTEKAGFRRIAVTVSLFGLAGGWLIEEVSKRLSGWLSQQVNNPTETSKE